ncbi:hypothetical protein IWGMT90018_60140 [Mycobacterium kiyosense]|nr:hypothetical protein IWGMT90018_60140 [Mycobacterium kiyosense]
MNYPTGDSRKPKPDVAEGTSRLQNASMHVLITGGTGFVGGWTAKAIADAGHSVRFLVRKPERLKTSVAALGGGYLRLRHR